MKRKWEEENDPDKERNYRQAGLTKETMDRISKWIENQLPKENDDTAE
jgi:hypothetical protein